MKKVFITMMLLTTLGMGTVTAQHHQPKEQQELVDSTSQNGVEVYSDTTTVDSLAAQAADNNVQDSRQYGSTLDQFMSEIDMEDMAGMFFVLAVLLILFVLAPVLIIVALFYFINKNRKEKLRLAQMAMQNGQPIPDKLLEEAPQTPADEYQKGLRQCFVGVGLMIFLYYAAGQVGFGVGALVFCIGLGKVIAARTAQKHETKSQNNDLYPNSYDKKIDEV